MSKLRVREIVKKVRSCGNREDDEEFIGAAEDIGMLHKALQLAAAQNRDFQSDVNKSTERGKLESELRQRVQNFLGKFVGAVVDGKRLSWTLASTSARPNPPSNQRGRYTVEEFGEYDVDVVGDSAALIVNLSDTAALPIVLVRARVTKVTFEKDELPFWVNNFGTMISVVEKGDEFWLETRFVDSRFRDLPYLYAEYESDDDDDDEGSSSPGSEEGDQFRDVILFASAEREEDVAVYISQRLEQLTEEK